LVSEKTIQPTIVKSYWEIQSGSPGKWLRTRAIQAIGRTKKLLWKSRRENRTEKQAEKPLKKRGGKNQCRIIIAEKQDEKTWREKQVKKTSMKIVRKKSCEIIFPRRKTCKKIEREKTCKKILVVLHRDEYHSPCILTTSCWNSANAHPHLHLL